MHKYKFLIYSLFICCSLIGNDNNCHHDNNNFRCVKFIKNYDADTITFNIPNVHPLLGENISIRVTNIDTPEMKTSNNCEKDLAQKSKLYVESILKQAHRIDLINISRDKYFRIVADVIIDGKSLTQLLLQNKYGYQYDGGTKRIVN